MVPRCRDIRGDLATAGNLDAAGEMSALRSGRLAARRPDRARLRPRRGLARNRVAGRERYGAASGQGRGGDKHLAYGGHEGPRS